MSNAFNIRAFTIWCDDIPSQRIRIPFSIVLTITLRGADKYTEIFMQNFDDEIRSWLMKQFKNHRLISMEAKFTDKTKKLLVFKAEKMWIHLLDSNPNQVELHTNTYHWDTKNVSKNWVEPEKVMFS